MTGVTVERKISLGTIISAVIQIGILIFLVGQLYAGMLAADAKIAELQAWTKDANLKFGTVETRLTTSEVNQRVTADRGVQTATTLKEMQGQILQILQQTAAINATLKGRGEQ